MACRPRTCVRHPVRPVCVPTSYSSVRMIRKRCRSHRSLIWFHFSAPRAPTSIPTVAPKAPPNRCPITAPPAPANMLDASCCLSLSFSRSLATMGDARCLREWRSGGDGKRGGELIGGRGVGSACACMGGEGAESNGLVTSARDGGWCACSGGGGKGFACQSCKGS